MNRRELIGALGMAAAGGTLLPWATNAKQTGKSALTFLNVKDFGAKGDGTKLDSAAINKAIDICNERGGGMVYVPPGIYLSGTVILKSNVTLFVEAGATILGSKKVSDYTPQPGPGLLGDANQKHLIFARDAENVTLAGPGRIDGQGPSFWVPSGRNPPPPEMSWSDVATYDWKPLDRPSPMLEFYNCKNVCIEDVRIENAPGWTLRPIECKNVFIRGITIKNPTIGPNTDGIDITCSQNVFISDCLIDTGDDAICLKTDNAYSGSPRVSKNITITNCVLTSCCNGFKIGTATAGGFENITFSNSVIFNEDVDFRRRVIAGIALEMVDGGWLDGVMISNIRMQRVRTPIFIRRGIRHPSAEGTLGILRSVMIENIHATGSILTSSITGIPGFEVEDVTLTNIRINSEESGKAEWASREIPEKAESYPEARMFGRLPAYGFYCRHVAGLRLRDVHLEAAPAEARPALVCEDAKNLEIQNLATNIENPSPVIKLSQCQNVVVRDCVAAKDTKVFLDVRGDKTDRIASLNNILAGATRNLGSGVAQSGVVSHDF